MGLLGKLQSPQLAHEDPYTLEDGEWGPTTDPCHMGLMVTPDGSALFESNRCHLPAKTRLHHLPTARRVVLSAEAAETSACLDRLSYVP